MSDVEAPKNPEITRTFPINLRKNSIIAELGEPIVSDPAELEINPEELRGRTALITGATSGLGAATAELFSSFGMNVIIVGRDLKRGTDSLRRVTETGGEGMFIQGDISIPERATEIVRLGVAEFGRIDVGVLNAGIVSDAPITEMTPDQWYDVTHGVVDMTFFPAQALAKRMIDQENSRIPNLIFVSSVSEIGNKQQANYSSAKAGIEALAKVFAREFSGISVGIFRPGFINTEMLRNEEKGLRTAEVLAKGLPAGRVFTAEEAARGPAYLASLKESGHVLTLA